MNQIGTLRHSKSHRAKINRDREGREIERDLCHRMGLPFPSRRPHGTVEGDYSPLKAWRNAQAETAIARDVAKGCGVMTIDARKL